MIDHVSHWSGYLIFVIDKNKIFFESVTFLLNFLPFLRKVVVQDHKSPLKLENCLPLNFAFLLK